MSKGTKRRLSYGVVDAPEFVRKKVVTELCWDEELDDALHHLETFSTNGKSVFTRKGISGVVVRLFVVLFFFSFLFFSSGERAADLCFRAVAWA